MVSDWRKANPEVAKSRALAYRQSHREQARQNTAQWYANNTDRAKVSMAEYRQKNRDKLLAKAAVWRASNSEMLKARCAEWYKANTEYAKAKNAIYRKSNIQKYQQQAVAWYAENIERARASRKAWGVANPGKRKAYNQNRRANKINNGGRLSADIVKKLFQLQRGKCACCGQPLMKNYHLDHIMPLALGGMNDDLNVQLLTQRCNNQKGAKPPLIFMQSRGFLL
jgi:5-methylcytosine-specific restriction endonuclease McrA